MSSETASYREVTDANNRVYRIGESDRELLGRSRAWMVWLPWLAMMAVSVYEYGYGAAQASIREAHGWSHSQTFWLLSIWAFFQALVAFPAGKLREKGIVSARAAMLVGAVLSALGFFSITQDSLVIAYLGFAACGGIGAGLVYATCINIVGKWYPERRGGKTGFVNGGFAYGAVPFIFIFSFALHPNTYVLVLDLVGVYMLVVCAACGMLFRDPPKNWWPADIDPLQWASQNGAKSSLAKNPPAVRQYTPMEAIKTGMLPLMWLSLGISAGVSLFGISYMVPFAKDLGFGPLIAASSAGVLSIINGTGRTLTGYISDRFGRKQTLTHRAAGIGSGTDRPAVHGPGQERDRVPLLRLPRRLRRWRVLPDVRLPDSRLLRREQQRQQLRPHLQLQAARLDRGNRRRGQRH